MKNIFRLVRCGRLAFLVVCLLTITKPLHAQWIQINVPFDSEVNTFAVSGWNLFAGTEGDGVFLSTNYGTSWTEVNTGLTNTSVWAFAVSGWNLFAGTYFDGIFLSTNNGTSWTEVNAGLMNTDINNFAISDTNLFVGTWGGGVFFSTNNGTSWVEFNTGLTNGIVSALAISGKYIFAGTHAGVWRRVLYDMITKVERLSTVLPTHFSLDQNYPNPFNQETNISFGLPSKSFVSLKVFDLKGREVSKIVSEELSAGIYSQQWNANRLPSGVYFYRLQAGTFTETKKLILLK